MSKAAKRERQRQNKISRREYEEALEKRRKFWRSARTFAIIAVPIVALFLFLALRNSNDSSDSNASDQSSQAERVKDPLPKPEMTIDTSKTYTAKVETSQGTFTIELATANAPTSVNNFVYLARAGFYDGLDVFRVAQDLFQTGSPTNTAVGGPGYTIQAELPTAPYELGSVAWGKRSIDPPGTAGSQFFVITDTNSLTLDYGIIGRVTDGLDVLTKISALAPASGDGTPTKPVTMTKVTITES